MAGAAEQPAVRAWVALGTNLGDRDEALALALRALAEDDAIRVIDCSGVYETDPVGPGDQRPYLNAVAELRTRLAAPELLARLHAIEARAGRRRDPGTHRWESRELDLDLLLYGDEAELCIDTPELVVPHPRIAERPFVLVPLAEIAADLLHPTSGQSVRALLASLPGGPSQGLPAGVRHWARCERIGA